MTTRAKCRKYVGLSQYMARRLEVEAARSGESQGVVLDAALRSFLHSTAIQRDKWTAKTVRARGGSTIRKLKADDR